MFYIRYCYFLEKLFNIINIDFDGFFVSCVLVVVVDII